MGDTDINRWYKVALFNLCVLTIMGILLRYKLVFSLPALEYKKLLHAHSHFAFAGWISFLLQIIIIHHIYPLFQKQRTFWNNFLILSTVVNYGMIFSFAQQGYAPVSIVFSTASMFLSYVFAWKVFTGIPASEKHNTSSYFIKASLLFSIISSAGPYLLAYLMNTRSPDVYLYHNAQYWFLHFQYNGWFAFAIMGLLMHKLETAPEHNRKRLKTFFLILFVTCIPAYFLTILVKERPLWVTGLNIFAALGHAVALMYFIRILMGNVKHIFQKLPATSKWLFSLSFLAFGIKIFLQFFSAHPEIGLLAFTYRPVIIGYLHLVFLGFASLFLLAWLADTPLFEKHLKMGAWGLFSFAFLVFLNELLLAAQGVAAITGWFRVIQLNMALFVTTVLLFVSSMLIVSASRS
jgi:hypothetical protein